MTEQTDSKKFQNITIKFIAEHDGISTQYLYRIMKEYESKGIKSPMPTFEFVDDPVTDKKLVNKQSTNQPP